MVEGLRNVNKRKKTGLGSFQKKVVSKKEPSNHGRSQKQDARSNVEHDYNEEKKVVTSSILDWKLLNQPDNMIGHSFIFVGVTFFFTLIAYKYWLMRCKWFNNYSLINSVLNSELYKVLIMDALMSLSSLVTFYIVKCASKSFLIKNNKTANVVYGVWAFSWFTFFIVKAHCYNWSWSKYLLYSPHVLTILMKQHAYYSTNMDLLQEGSKALKDINTIKNKAGPPKKHKNDMNSDENHTKESVSPLIKVSLKEYIIFLFRPVFLYDAHYAKSERIRLEFLCWKIVCLFLALSVLYFVAEYLTIPLLHMSHSLPTHIVIMLLSVPSVMCYMLLFYILFECITNIVAELTRDRNRDFYGVWWGTGDFSIFYRDWNKPVNMFLKTYVYKKLIKKFNAPSALFFTFLLSAIFHEIVMYTIARSPYPYIFVIMMTLVPILLIQNSKIITMPHLLVLFNYWILFFTFLPLTVLLYYRSARV